MPLVNGYRTPLCLAEADDGSMFGDLWMVDDAMFGVDGRGEDYEHVFEWPDMTDPIWEGDGYEVRGLPDFEPDCVVLRHGGRTVGFYIDSMSWIDPEHRGKGLAPWMIVSLCSMTGNLPNCRDIGYTEAGYAAHAAAMRLARELAEDSFPGPSA